MLNKQWSAPIGKNFVFGYDPDWFNTNYKDDFQKKNGINEQLKPLYQR